MLGSTETCSLLVLRRQSDRLTVSLLVFLAICLFGPPAEAKYGGGTGEPKDPYLIYTAEQMNAIGADANDWDKHFKLMADIDLTAYSGREFNIIGWYRDWTYSKPFTGVFDGNSHIISNFAYTSTGRKNIGLFGYVAGPTGEIRDLGLMDPHVDAGRGDHVGSLVAFLGSNANNLWGGGTISGCYVRGGGVVGGNDVGGLVGYSNCLNSISNCYAITHVRGEYRVGGLLGTNSGYITECFSKGNVAGNADVGGLVGLNYETIGYARVTDCYATGAVTGENQVGGLVGRNDDDGNIAYGQAVISRCYSTGYVSGVTGIGGLVGRNTHDNLVIDSFWDVETSGQIISDEGIGKMTVLMQTASTFIGWGCNSIWIIDDGAGYPQLAWENGSGQFIAKPTYGGGSGEPNDPYLIYTAEQFYMIGSVRCDWNKHFKLIVDIDLDSYVPPAFNTIGTWDEHFTGCFDGNGKKILNFMYAKVDGDFAGLFGFVGDYQGNGEVRDLGLIDPNVDAGEGYYVSSLVGHLEKGTITGCYVQGGRISGYLFVGGLVGRISHGTVTNCWATTSVSGYREVGGLVGDTAGAMISDSYSTGSVKAVERTGGLVGEYYYGTIKRCWSAGNVTGEEYVGGLAGYNYEGEVTDSFWDTQTSKQATSAGGTGKTTAEMQTQDTFTSAGWDFVEIWGIGENQTYPYLRVYPAGDLNHDGRVDLLDLAELGNNWLADLRSD